MLIFCIKKQKLGPFVRPARKESALPPFKATNTYSIRESVGLSLHIYLPSSETIVSSAAPLSLYDTEEKGKIYPCAEMRITILTFSSYCIYVALPDISAFF